MERNPTKLYCLLNSFSNNNSSFAKAENMKKIWEKLKVKWNIETDRRMIWIFIMFGITGTSVTFVRQPFTEFFFEKSTYLELHWYEFLITFVVVYIVYQFFLFTIGCIMGEYNFVRWFLIKMNKRMLPFLKNLE